MNTAMDSHSSDPRSSATPPPGKARPAAAGGEGSATRRRILEIALSLMSQRGVDGTSMRDLASACDLTVASLYHYCPSKRELLEAVLVEHGFLPLNTSNPDPRKYDDIDAPLGQMLADIMV